MAENKVNENKSDVEEPKNEEGLDELLDSKPTPVPSNMAENKGNENKSDVEEPKNEEGLDELLDSALDDFNETPKEKPAAKKEDTHLNAKAEETVEVMWAEMLKQALQGDPSIEGLFQQGSSDGNKFVEDIAKIAEAAGKVIQEGETSNNFADIMSETLRTLNESSETIQNHYGNPDELANLLQEMGLNGPCRPDGSLEEIPSFMQSMMQSFLSKDILYPSMKEIVERYPVWLEEHKSTLTPEEYENYCKQLDQLKKVVEEFEAESESDSDDVKKQRFQKILQYMQQMQSLGQPPAELISSDMPFDESVMPSFPPGADPNQCCTM